MTGSNLHPTYIELQGYRPRVRAPRPLPAAVVDIDRILNTSLLACSSDSAQAAVAQQKIAIKQRLAQVPEEAVPALAAAILDELRAFALALGAAE